MNLPANIKEWLNNRGITDDVIEANDLSWNGSAIVIPIHDHRGKFLFNKYRRDPFSDEGPKYMYDKGTAATLYNAHKIIHSNGQVIICEGELDVLALESKGYCAVSSTGGSGTFKEEWVEIIELREFSPSSLSIIINEIFVCYDNDEAGYSGAVKVLSKIPNAKWAILPDSVGKGGDITDYLTAGGDFKIILRNAEHFAIFDQKEPDEITTIKEASEWIRSYKSLLRALQDHRRARSNEGKPVKHIDYIMPFIANRIENLERLKRKIRYNKKRKSGDIFDHPVDGPGKVTDQQIEEAKRVPITNFYHEKITTAGGRATGRCPFHDEQDASFTIYLEQNTFFCYGCSTGRDVIDYVQKERGVEFHAAVKIILNL